MNVPSIHLFIQYAHCFSSIRFNHRAMQISQVVNNTTNILRRYTSCSHKYMRDWNSQCFFNISISYLGSSTANDKRTNRDPFPAVRFILACKASPPPGWRAFFFSPVSYIFFFRRFSLFFFHNIFSRTLWVVVFYFISSISWDAYTKRPSVPSGRALERSRSCQTKHSLVWQPLASLTWYRATTATSAYLS